MKQQHDLALLLLQKAEEDETAVDILMANQGISDAIVGFHLQQAAEKLLKAMLAEAGADVRKTHNLDVLMEMCGAAGHPVPAKYRPVAEPNAFAVEFRYDLPANAASVPLDRSASRVLVGSLRSWVETQVAEFPSGGRA